MRGALVLVITAGCRQWFDLESPQLSLDAATVIAIDAPRDAAAVSCTARWLAGPKLGDVAPLAGVNTIGGEHNPFVTTDGNTLYFVRDADIFVARRGAHGFGSPAIDPVLSSSSNDGKVSVSSDGLRAFFSSNRVSGVGGRDIWRGSRASDTDAWTIDQQYLGNVNDPNQQYDPHISTDTLRLYFAPKASGQRIVMSSRAATTEAFSAPDEVELASVSIGGDDYDPSLSADERVIVFGSTRSGNRDLWYATRASTAASFGAATALTTLNTGGADENPHLSSDGCTLYFSSDRGGTADLYVTSIVE
jgi:hypothetical protein